MYFGEFCEFFPPLAPRGMKKVSTRSPSRSQPNIGNDRPKNSPYCTTDRTFFIFLLCLKISELFLLRPIFFFGCIWIYCEFDEGALTWLYFNKNPKRSKLSREFSIKRVVANDNCAIGYLSRFQHRFSYPWCCMRHIFHNYWLEHEESARRFMIEEDNENLST